ncbi:SH3 beta-barrel fold-containing protein [uncultured Alistipes sp.]|uniref:SH3 beta-barrel fold-containing protein n=1 Tax=uncultured Alistipes sp. TaxID=538949 RepID=UPI0026114670|nr:SH3 beta-barrel fold-containing protein [uncultured Alistipes sp.]
MTQVILLNHNTAVRAKVIAVRTSSRMMDGISKALLIEQLKKKLRSGQIVKFVYLKSNGDIRVAYGTTNADFVKDKVCGWGESRECYATTAYFDLEKAAWRSFLWENLIAMY